MKRLITIVALLVGCGDAGGAASVEGAEGADTLGDLVECDTITEPFGPSGTQRVYSRQEHALIPTSPGDVLTITQCDRYHVVNGVDVVDELPFDDGPTGCITYEVTAEGDEFDLFCSETIDDSELAEITEYGFAQSYARRQ